MSESVCCNLCGEKSYQVIYPEGVAQVNQIVKCSSCGLMYANPRASVDADKIVNQDPQWLLKHLYLPWIRRRIYKERLQTRDYKSTMNYLNIQFPQKGIMLEIGSGFGFLRKYFEDAGWQSHGIEPSVALCNYAEEKLSLTSFPNPLEKSNLANGYYDVALMMHVIEHLGDPLSCLKLIHQKLKKGGVLVLETPRYDTLMFKMLGKWERSLSCNGHIYFFTTSTLTQMSLKAGFEVKKIDYVGRSVNLAKLFYNLGLISKNDYVAHTLEKIAELLRLNKLWLSINLRDMQRIYLRKQ